MDLSGRSVDVAGDLKAVLKRKISPSAVYRGDFRHIELKRMIDQFARAVYDPAMVADVLVTDLKLSIETFAKIGDYEPMVDHIYATMRRLETLLQSLDPAERPPIVAALLDLAERWKGWFGYGISDELLGMALDWAERGKAL
jgi:hypothetical protein